MKQTFLLLLFVGCGWLTAFCQNGRLTGLVLDKETETPLELATVSIFSTDSSLLAYQLSDKAGRFQFEKLPLKQKLQVSITYAGFLAFHTALYLEQEKPDTLRVLLLPNLKDTGAIVVTATVPIRINGDTLEINPAAFKLNPDAVVEELLNQVPGITIWSDGSITVNGRKVQNLFVDGKPFLGSSDSRMATQNLPKAAIDKIQLYQEYDRSQIGRQSEPKDSLLTMNIQLKEESKKGYFGKAGGGLGSTERFEADLSFQLYNKRSSAGIGGGINNINKDIGNLQDLFQNNTYRSYNPNLYRVGRFGGNGISRNHSIGAAITHNFIETANSRQNNRLMVNYNKSGTDAFVTDLTLQNRTTVENPQKIREEGVQDNRSDRHELGINYAKTNSYQDNLNVNANVSRSNDRGQTERFTEVRDTGRQLQSTNRITSQQRRQSDDASFNVSFAHGDEGEPLKNYNLQFSGRLGNTESERDLKSDFVSFSNSAGNTAHNRRYSSGSQNVSLNGTLDYTGFKRLLLGRYNLFGIRLNFTQWFNYNRSEGHDRVSDYDSTAKQYQENTVLTNQNTGELLEYTPALSLQKNFFKWSETYYRSFDVQVKLLEDVKWDKNISSIANRNLSRSFGFFRYEGSLFYNYQMREKYRYYLSVNYRKNYGYPSINQLYTLVDDVNAYDIRVGNPNLPNQVRHQVNFNANFNTEKPKSVYTLNGYIGGGYNVTDRPITDSVINDPSGKRISYFVSAGSSKNLNLNYNGNVARRFGKNSLQLMYNGSFSTGQWPNYVDGIYNTSETNNLSNELNLQFSLRTLLVLNLGKALQRSKSRQSAAGLTSFENTSNRTKLGLVLNFSRSVTFSTTVDHQDNSMLQKPIVLWNAFATCRLLKQQGELKFSAMDLLKQYVNISNSAGAYGTTTRITNGLQQYFLATFSYYPRKFGKTAIARPQAAEVVY